MIRSVYKVFVVVAAILSAAFASATPSRTYPVDALREDLRVLWAVLDEGHAGLERYTPREVLESRFNDAADRLQSPLSEIEFYRELLPLISEIKDGHTELRLSPATQRELLARPFLFPFELRFIGEKTHLFRNLSGDRTIPDGTEILAINGIPIAEIRRLILSLVPSDAGIVSRRLRLLENPSTFGFYLAIVYSVPESFRIRFRSLSGATEGEATVAGASSAELSSIRRERYPQTAVRKPLYELGYRGSTAVITIRGFEDDMGGVRYPEFIQRTFNELSARKIESLIIDLRGNEGGEDEYGRLLFAHFMDRPFIYYRALEMKRNRYDLFRYASAPRDNWPGEAVRKNARGWYDVLAHPNVGTLQPETPRFAGRTCILVDGLSFSATGECTSLIHFHRKAVFLGEECGAGYYGNTSGSAVFITLPNSGLRAVIPLVLYTVAVDGYPSDRGIIPDIAVVPSIEDMLAGRDIVMEYALDYLSNK